MRFDQIPVQKLTEVRGLFFKFGMVFSSRRCNSRCIQMTLGSGVHAAQMSSGTCTQMGWPAFPLAVPDNLGSKQARSS